MQSASVKRFDSKPDAEELRRRILIYEKTMGAIADGFFVVDREGTLIEMNKAYCDYIGVKREDAIGKHISEVIFNSKMLDIMTSKTTEIDSFHQYEDGQTVSGEKMIAVSRVPVMDGDEVIAAVALVKFSKYTISLADKLRKLEEQVEYYRKELRKHQTSPFLPEDIPSASPFMEEAKRLTARFADNDLPVLLLGETGVGKDIFANAVHLASDRKDGPFVCVNCASIPAELLESEFFGYAEGAFTGSRKGGKKGKFEMADGGTLFLDEIGDMPLSLQSKLLRVLQTQEVEKLGAEKSTPVNVRIVAATNQDLNQKVEEKLFRPDLLYRLNVLTVNIPPLRDRREDIPVLAEYFIEELNDKYGRSVSIAPEAMLALSQHDWPGNARELRNAIGRGFMLTETDRILPQHLPSNLFNHRAETQVSLPDVKMRKEQEMILSCLSSFNGNMTKTAKALGIHRSTLYTKLAAFGINGKSFRSRHSRK